METLGAFLLRAGVLERDQLVAALDRQAAYGGTLDTAILECGRLDEATMIQWLSVWSQVPTCTQEEMGHPERAAMIALPGDLAAQHVVAPLKLTSEAISLATTAPVNVDALAHLGGMIGMAVLPYVTTELSIRRALSTVYGIPIGARFKELAARLEGVTAPPPAAETTSGVTQPPVPPAAAVDNASRPPPPPPSKPPATPLEFADAAAQLMKARDREAAIDVLLRFATQHFQFVVAMGVLRGHAMVLSARQQGRDDPMVGDALRGVVVPLKDAPELRTVTETNAPLIARPTAGPVGRSLPELLNRGLPRAMFLAPGLIGGRTALVLYADQGEWSIRTGQAGEVLALVARVGVAFERMIRERRKRTGASVSTTPRPHNWEELAAATSGVPVQLPPAPEEGSTPPAAEPPSPPTPDAVPPGDAVAPSEEGNLGLLEPMGVPATFPEFAPLGPPVDEPLAVEEEPADEIPVVVDTSDLAETAPEPAAAPTTDWAAAVEPLVPEATPPAFAPVEQTAEPATPPPPPEPQAEPVAPPAPDPPEVPVEAAVPAPVVAPPAPSQTPRAPPPFPGGNDRPRAVPPFPGGMASASMHPLFDRPADSLDEALARLRAWTMGDEEEDQEEENNPEETSLVSDATWNVAMAAALEQVHGSGRRDEEAASGTNPSTEKAFVLEESGNAAAFTDALKETIQQGKQGGEARSEAFRAFKEKRARTIPPLPNSLAAPGGQASPAVSQPPAAAPSPPAPVAQKLSPPAPPPAPAGREPSPEHWVVMLDDPDPQRVAQACDALVAYGAAAVPALTAVFPGRVMLDPFGQGSRGMDVATASPLLDVVCRLGPMGLPVAVAHINSGFAAHRLFATLVLIRTFVPSSIPHFLLRLNDDEPRIRKLASDVLAEHAKDPAFEQVLRHLRTRASSTVVEARRRALHFLGYFRDIKSIPLFISALKAKDTGLVQEAAEALKQISLQDFGTAEKKWAAWWEKNKERAREEWLMESLRHADADVRAKALTELLAITGDSHGFRPDDNRKSRDEALKRWDAWWKEEVERRRAAGKGG